MILTNPNEESRELTPANLRKKKERGGKKKKKDVGERDRWRRIY